MKLVFWQKIVLGILVLVFIGLVLWAGLHTFSYIRGKQYVGATYYDDGEWLPIYNDNVAAVVKSNVYNGTLTDVYTETETGDLYFVIENLEVPPLTIPLHLKVPRLIGDGGLLVWDDQAQVYIPYEAENCPSCILGTIVPLLDEGSQYIEVIINEVFYSNDLIKQYTASIKIGHE